MTALAGVAHRIWGNLGVDKGCSAGTWSRMNVPILSVRLDALCWDDLLVMASNRRWLHSGPRCMLGVCPRRCGRAKNKNKNRFGRLSSTPSEDKSTITSKDVRPLALS